MSSVIIFEKDLKKLGKNLMKEFYHQIHDKYMLETFDEVRLKKKYYNENFTKKFLSFHKYKERTNDIKDLYFSDKKYEDLVEMESEILLSKLEDKIQKETLDYELIFQFLDQMDRNLEINKKIDFEIDEDLFCMKKAFINLYNVYHSDYHYLEIEFPTF